MTDMFDADLSLEAIKAHHATLPKTLIPDAGRDAVVPFGEGGDEVLAETGHLLAAAHLLAGKPSVKDWNGLGAEEIAARLEAAKPVLQKAILAAPLEAVEGQQPDTSPAPEDQTPPPAEDTPIATGPAIAMLLKASDLGAAGEVVRVSRAKLAALGLKPGKDWRSATPAERETAGK